MNLLTYININAGGPGSGRHPEGNATEGNKPDIKWKTSDVPTGKFSSFQKRDWPSAEYKNGSVAAMIHSKDEYKPSNVKTNSHAPLTVRVADHSQTPWQWRKLTGEFKTLQEAKDAAGRILEKYPHFQKK